MQEQAAAGSGEATAAQAVQEMAQAEAAEQATQGAAASGEEAAPKEAPKSAGSASSGGAGNPIDRFSFANIHEVQTEHVHMNLNVDFASSTIKGVVDHKMKVGSLDGSSQPAAISKVVLDVQGMNVEKVELLAGDAAPPAPKDASFLQLDEETEEMKKKEAKKVQKAKVPAKKAKAKDSKEEKKPEPKKAAPAVETKALTFQVGALVQDVGQPLTIDLPE